jgi:hypothetical protein
MIENHTTCLILSMTHLHKCALHLTDVNPRIQTLTHVHHNVCSQQLQYNNTPAIKQLIHLSTMYPYSQKNICMILMGSSGTKFKSSLATVVRCCM